MKMIIETINSFKSKRRNQSHSNKTGHCCTNGKHRVFPDVRVVTQDVCKHEESPMRSDAISTRGSNLNDHYHVIPKATGQGVAGSVYPAIHRKTRKVYAVKSIKKATARRKDRIMREITFLREVNHPNIIKAYGVYEDDHAYHIVTEMCYGSELFDKIVEKASSGIGCFLERDAARIISDLLSAVSYLHKLNIVHRDIKPENILFTEENNDMSSIKLIDFGLSVRHTEDHPKLANCVGTAYYMAPEILNGSYDRSCDLWSVGVIAFVMLCGRPPFNGSNDDKVFARIMTGKYSMDTPHWHGITDDAKDFVRKLLQMDPAKRMTAGEALEHPWVVDNKMELD
ncbi:hypothetical protein HJC23_007703 [Cyclotella cryptica]|uniref:non-specific serine/threonine protein kinase n=1 Tax=Cyclotella cryptica TaxID=29204 RepID=A0ABD3PR42_9STRA|eukprot:CCRYP_012257-RA/>CCRYP_012257-RA protein AED:0.02 eAED:-0.02 QI:0/-1/0/1/-1/1/1/0/340